jgi:hypothetical protein
LAAFIFRWVKLRNFQQNGVYSYFPVTPLGYNFYECSQLYATITRTSVRILKGGEDVNSCSASGIHTEGKTEREVKEWIRLMRIGQLDYTNIAAVINYLYCMGLITSIERIKLKAFYERKK